MPRPRHLSRAPQVRARSCSTRAVVGLVATLALAAPASAQPVAAIVVQTTGARVEITRSPFRMAFFDRSGRKVLEEVAPGTSPTPIAPRVQPAPLGAAGLNGSTRYAPLAFLVGARQDAQYGPGSVLWQGNALAGVDGGVMYAPTKVLDAAHDGGGVRLTLATDDPTGRQLIVTVEPFRGAAIRVHAEPSNPVGVAEMSDSFASGPDEAFHGFGGRHNSLDERGQSFYNWVEEENLGPGGLQPLGDAVSGGEEGGGSGHGGYLFPNGPTAAYNVQSLFVSSRPYGFMLTQPQMAAWRLDSDRPDAWQVSVAAPAIDYIITPGDGVHAVGSLNAITGRQLPPPDWALGAGTSRLYGPSDSAASYEQHVRDDIAAIRANHLPITMYELFAWQSILRQPGGESKLRDIISQFHALGIHVLGYFLPWGSVHGSGYTNQADFQDILNQGIYVHNAAGAPYVMAPTVEAGAAGLLIDFTNPAARAFWRQRVFEALNLGLDGFMEDYGEQVTNDMHFHNGQTGATMHNAYPVIYHQVSRSVVAEYEALHPGRQIWRYTRSGFSGVDGGSGSEAYTNANFPGDEDASWAHNNGLAGLTSDMLNRGLGGAFGFATDVGGYSGTTTEELLLRWAQWSALSPYSLIHNSDLSTTVQPWEFGPQALAVYDHVAQLRLAASGYLHSLWSEAEQTGMPITRPLWLTYPGDRQAAVQEQEWMLGGEVLVAPVVTQHASSRSVYFPAGCWVRPETGGTFRGPVSIMVPADLSQLPYFFKCGTRPFSPPPPAPAWTGGSSGAAGCVTGVQGTSATACDPTGRFSSPQQQGFVSAGANLGAPSATANVCDGTTGSNYGAIVGAAPGFSAGGACPHPGG